MNILINSDYHEGDFIYNRYILDKISAHRNILTSVIGDDPLFEYRLKILSMKIKAYIPKPDKIIVGKILELAKKRKVFVLELVTNDENSEIESLAYKIVRSYSYTYLIDLTKSVDELYANISDSRRGSIKSARGKGVRVTSELDEATFNAWWEQYLDTVKSGNFVPEKKWFVKDILFSKQCTLFTAWMQDDLLAGAMVSANNYPFYFLGSSSKEYARYNASSLIQWHIIEHYKREGYIMYDMGGASQDVNQGTSKFKKAFGGELKKTVHYKVILKPIANQIISLLKDIYYKGLKKPAF